MPLPTRQNTGLKGRNLGSTRIGQNDDQHNHVDTRDKLKEYDPALAALLTEVFGDTDWRYTQAVNPLASLTSPRVQSGAVSEI